MSNSVREHMLAGIEQGTRIDGRTLDQYREVSIETGVSATAEGSARVKIGDTEVIAGVKLSVDKPYPDTPKQGNLMVNVELLPMASKKFESGPPSIESIELARVTDRGVRESEMIDVEKLCIEEGEKVWTVIIDICTINYDGNLFDAASLAALAALKAARLPTLNDDGTVDYKNRTKDTLPIEKEPLGVTVYKIGDHVFVDPKTQEEEKADARLTVCSLADGTLSAMQKGGEGSLTAEDVEKMIDLAVARAKESRKLCASL